LSVLRVADGQAIVGVEEVQVGSVHTEFMAGEPMNPATKRLTG